MKKKKELTDADLYNGWLVKYHGITVEELLKKEPELCQTREWYVKYAVTQEQHDEWYKWAITEICKYRKCSRKYAERNFSFDYLNIAPSVKKLDNE